MHRLRRTVLTRVVTNVDFPPFFSRTQKAVLRLFASEIVGVVRTCKPRLQCKRCNYVKSSFDSHMAPLIFMYTSKIDTVDDFNGDRKKSTTS